MVLGSVGMMMCPKHHPYYYEQKAKARAELRYKQIQEGKPVTEKLKEKKTVKQLATGLSWFFNHSLHALTQGAIFFIPNTVWGLRRPLVLPHSQQGVNNEQGANPLLLRFESEHSQQPEKPHPVEVDMSLCFFCILRQKLGRMWRSSSSTCRTCCWSWRPSLRTTSYPECTRRSPSTSSSSSKWISPWELFSQVDAPTVAIFIPNVRTEDQSGVSRKIKSQMSATSGMESCKIQLNLGLWMFLSQQSFLRLLFRHCGCSCHISGSCVNWMDTEACKAENERSLDNADLLLHWDSSLPGWIDVLELWTSSNGWCSRCYNLQVRNKFLLRFAWLSARHGDDQKICKL